MDIVKLVWFFLWRMILLGLGLGATLGAERKLREFCTRATRR